MATTQERISALEGIDPLTLVGHREAVDVAQTLEAVYASFRDHAWKFIGVTSGDGRLLGVTSR